MVSIDRTSTPCSLRVGPLYPHPHAKQAQADNVAAIHRIAATDTKEYEKVRELRDSEGWDPDHTDTSWRLAPTWAVLRAATCPTWVATPCGSTPDSRIRASRTTSKRGSKVCT